VLSIFKKYFSDQVICDIVKFTNDYKIDGKSLNPSLRKGEAKVLIGVLILFGVYQISDKKLGWPNGLHKLQGAPTPHLIEESGMSRHRFQDVLRFFRVSKEYPVFNVVDRNDTEQKRKYAYSRTVGKIEYIWHHVRKTSKLIYKPSSNVSVDEVMVRFGGRSAYTFLMRQKPDPRRYKVFALADSNGFISSFHLAAAGIKSNLEFPRQDYYDGCTSTAEGVIWLINDLLSKPSLRKRVFRVFMDNFFSSTKLFSYLRSQGIGACGTFRSNYYGRLDKEVDVRKLPVHSVVSRNEDGVLCTIWRDVNAVHIMTTIHEADEKCTMRKHLPSSALHGRGYIASGLRMLFTNEVTGRVSREKDITVPKWILEYNEYMGGVDLADQLRSYHGVGKIFRRRRTWFSLFLWILDHCLVNTCIVYDVAHGRKCEKKAARAEIAHELINEGLTEMATEKVLGNEEDYIVTREQAEEIEAETESARNKKRRRVDTAKILSPSRFEARPEHHFPISYKELSGSRESGCFVCRWEALVAYGRVRTSRTGHACVACKVCVCKPTAVLSSCWKKLHDSEWLSKLEQVKKLVTNARHGWERKVADFYHNEYGDDKSLQENILQCSVYHQGRHEF